MSNRAPDEFVERISCRNAAVGVIGLGYVGLPISLKFAAAGFNVRGFDIDDERVTRLHDADSYVNDVSNDELVSGLDDGFVPASDPDNVADCDAYVIAVPTDANDGKPDMSAVRAATKTVSEQAGHRDTLVVVSSTVYPGATQEFVAPILETHRPPDRTHLAMVPERLNPGGEYDASEIPLVVGADTDVARTAAREFFDSIVVETHPVDSTTTAELTKTLENTYRMVNIALVNEMAKLAEEMGADIWEVIEAADTKPFGFQAFRPGPGVGGHCIPVDPQFLVWQGHNYEERLTLVEQAQHANNSMPVHVAERVSGALAGRGVDIDGASLTVLGVSYKPDVGDIRNSPAVEVCQQLNKRGASLKIVDPYVDAVAIDDTDHDPANEIAAVDLSAVDGALVLVDHEAFEYNLLDEVPLAFDAQNALPKDLPVTVVTLGKDLPSLEHVTSRS